MSVQEVTRRKRIIGPTPLYVADHIPSTLVGAITASDCLSCQAAVAGLGEEFPDIDYIDRFRKLV